MALADQVNVYNGLLASLSSGVQLAALLAEQGASNESISAVRNANDRLAAAAAGVRQAIDKAWQLDTAQLLNDLNSQRAQLQVQLASIQASIDVAGKVVNAIGYIDEAVAVAAKVLAAV